MTSESGTIDVTQVKNLDVTANPAALGLIAFGLSTILLNLSNAGYFALGSMILAMGIFYGGLAHVVAGLMELEKEQHVRDDRIPSYGLFWLSLVTLLVLPKLGSAAATSASGMGAAYFGMWGRLYARHVHQAAPKTTRASQVVLIAYSAVPLLPAGAIGAR